MAELVIPLLAGAVLSVAGAWLVAARRRAAGPCPGQHQAARLQAARVQAARVQVARRPASRRRRRSTAGVGVTVALAGVLVAGCDPLQMISGMTGLPGQAVQPGFGGTDLPGFQQPPATDMPLRCHPSYADVCLLPDAVDYDCEGGAGDGPEFVPGPFRVVGEDVYKLDGNKNGIGCERL